MKKFLTTIICACIGFAIGLAQISGPWHGIVTVGQTQLPIVFNIVDEAGSYTATMDSPLQGAKGIPAEISLSNDTVSIAIPAIGAQYSGLYADGKISGEFVQNGYRLTLDLEPGEYVPTRPQTPKPPFPYETQEVTFTNPDDGYVLHGTLTLPMQYFRTGNRQFNAVVMVTGSGTQNRDEEVFGHKPFAVIAHHLALNGIASLRYDDRGYNDKSADLSQATTATFASDARSAVQYMRDSVARLSHVGVLGHSEGGTIAFILAADGDADFVVSLAGTAVKGDSIILKQNQQILANQLDEPLVNAYVVGLQRTLDYMRQNPEAKEWPGIAEALADLRLPPHLVNNLNSVVSTRNAWFDYFLDYDPTEAIKHISVPVFAANGTLDQQVDCHQNLGALRQLLPDNAKSAIKEYPGLNHLMQNGKTGSPSEYSEIEETTSPILLNDLTKWIKGL